jgi:Fe-S-cluster containining protein
VAYIPWRKVADWECTNCGSCCRRLKIILTAQESEEIAKHFGERHVVRAPVPRLKKNSGRCHFQRNSPSGSICLLQNTGLKPASCRTFPFMVGTKPLRGSGGVEAVFQPGNLYIYASDRCSSLKLGEPSDHLTRGLLPEVVEIALRGRRDQVHTTSGNPLAGGGRREDDMGDA